MTINRMCIVTRNIVPISELFRVVRTKSGEVIVDISNNIKGRGAYIKKDKDVILKAKKKNLLSKALKTNVNEDIYQQLIELL